MNPVPAKQRGVIWQKNVEFGSTFVAMLSGPQMVILMKLKIKNLEGKCLFDRTAKNS